MKQFGLRIIVLISTIVVSFQADANIDVACIDDDCLQNGWEAYNTRTRESYFVACHEGDCLTKGWTSENKGLLYNETYCKAGGCFTQGWSVYDSTSSGLVAEITCYGTDEEGSEDCLQFGWTTKEPGRGSYETRCVAGDCRSNGWDVFVPGFAAQPVRCKRGGCFATGWIVYQ